MRKALTWTVWLLILGAAGGAGYVYKDQLQTRLAELTNVSGAQAAAPPAFVMPVPVVKPVRRDVPIYLEYAARTEAIRLVTLRARVAGYVLEQLVPDGSDVQAGDLLYRIDPREYRVALDQARAQVTRSMASIDYLRSNLDRGNTLAQTGALSRDTFDQRASSLRQAEATLVADQAAIRLAELNLSHTEIRAPFAGRLGRDQAPVGTLVSASGAPLNTLVQVAPLYVTFNPSEGDLATIEAARAKGPVSVDILLPGETTPRQSGEITFTDNVVDRATGTTTMRATLANADRALLPGQYVRIRLKVRTEADTPMVPQAAVGSSQLGKYVYVVGEGNKVDQKLITLGPADGELVSVVGGGLKDSDLVISGNLQKIGPGAPVQPLGPQ